MAYKHHNKSCSQISRKNNKTQYISLDTLGEKAVEDKETETLSESTITYDRLMSAIEELPEGYKKIFKMYVLDGMSHQEIVAILNIAPKCQNLAGKVNMT